MEKIMKLYEVTNGYMAESYVRVVVITDSEESAIKIASEKFEYEARDTVRENGKYIKVTDKYKYDIEYWTRLEAECLCENINNGYVSEVIE